MKTPNVLSNYIEFPGKLPVKHKILYMLLESQSKFLSWNDIGAKAGISGPEVRETVKNLLDDGFPVETTTERGCRISGKQDILFPSRIHEHLETQVLGRKILYTLSTTSTNDDARLVANGHPGGTLLTCETQTQGKGRLGRQWESPRGGIFLSLILKPEIQPAKVPSLSLVAGCATAKTLQSLGLDALVKWPNDVLVHGRKLAGILCEISAEPDRVAHVIVGIGVNANVSKTRMPGPVRERSTSILDELGKYVDRNVLIAGLLNNFEAYYFRFLESGMQTLIPEIQEIMAYVGSPVIIHNTAFGSGETQHGILRGLDKHGRLLVLASTGEIKTYTAGDVSLRLE